MNRRIPRVLVTLLAVLVLVALPMKALDAQQAQDPRLAVLEAEDYVTPPPEILEAVVATTNQDLRLSSLDPSGRFFMRTISDGFPALARFAKRHYDLGQFQVDPAANRSRRLTTRSDVGIELYDTNAQLATTVQIPDGARITSPQWAPDGSALAYFAHFEDATHVYVADPDTGESRALTRTPVLATNVTSFQWTEDGEHIVTVLLPADRGPEPVAPEVPETPKVRLTTPDENRLRTYFDLLENPYEKSLVHYHATGQLARIEVGSGDVEPIGEPAMIRSVSPSSDGDYFRVTTMKDDLSYIVPVSSAGRIEAIWNAAGESLAVIEDEDVNEGVQGNGNNQNGNGDDKRGLTWRTDGPGMVFLLREPRPEREEGAEEQPEPEEEEEQPRMDRVMYWLPPFGDDDTQVVYETEDRIQSARFDESGRMLFLTRREGDTETVHAVSLDDPSEEFLIYEEDTEDRLADQGSLMSDRGSVRLSPDGAAVFLSGTQYFEDPNLNAPRPFVDRVEIRTGEKTRIFQSAEDLYETVGPVLDDDVNEVIVLRQSRTMVPNQWLVNFSTGERRQLTFNEDSHPLITAARRERFMITRPDGFESVVTVTLPHDYRDGMRVPGMFWFYPREYTDQDTYDERLESYNKNSFPNVGARSMSILTLLGYALIEPDVPIVGPEGQRNDEYPHDLRNTLATVIDVVSERGWVDRSRLGIGGHSYGAFGTANAMIQTPFFKAGIAGDGNYNRSLTPAGFQSERRYLWEAQDLYIEMSPFFQADRLTGALLMYHGMDDHNVGTHPIHADRMFHALEVLGKTASMYKYPFEDHGPATRETMLDLWARWVAWLDVYVKNAGAEEPPEAGGGNGGR